jgi:putative flippase GtrA
MTTRQSLQDNQISLISPTTFILFLSAGGFAAFVNLASRYLLTPVVGYENSIVIAYLIGMVVAFVLFRTMIFGRSGRSIGDESLRFVIVNIAALALVWLISVTLSRVIFPAFDFTWHSEDVAHFVGTCIPALSSYVGHSIYTFRKRVS